MINMREATRYNISNHLIKRKQLKLWRKREIKPDGSLCFRTNDYLGLAKHPKIIDTFKLALDKYGVGSSGASVLGGYSHAHQALEEALADFMGYPRALLFSTGYMANVSVISTVAKELNITEIYSDRLNHASINDGMRLSRIKFHRFRHRDYAQLQTLLLKNASQNTMQSMCLTEGVFGVDGDIAGLPELARLTKQHNSLLMVDDAHGFGILGKNGRGTFEHYNLSKDSVPLIMGTFGKALGTFGAFVVGSEELIELLIQFARSYIFTTALPPALMASTLASLQILQAEPWRRDYLKHLITYFRSKAEELGVAVLPSETPIQLVLTYDPETTLRYFERLKQKGFWVGALRPPTVPEGKCRLRINLNVSHSFLDVDALLEALQCINHDTLKA